ncbi:MAG: hypothetical protein HWE39_00990 [Oceanospirillaceae bacterium]|uniref:hypothetical protein n=1 Tax=Salipiger sp. HF18 TaxID=2721557 RepID=UPI00142E0968|nr:hypothetical protein [Salipiger sp. HF18]NIY97330.1 hypothetical protein [Salipiger sp. HF18]NVK39791.1 hypothetical protein [Oceanospirillaceae bacterium]
MPAHRKKGPSFGAIVCGGAAVIALLVIFGGFGLFYWQETNKPKQDPESLCLETGAVAQLVILIDETDPLTLTQLNFARTRIDRMIEEADVGTRISIGIVAPDAAEREAAFVSICRPAEQANALSENVKMVRDRYHEKFLNPVNGMLDDLMVVSERDSSPILESLQELLSRIPGFLPEDVPAKLVILSNLAQHSSTLSFYKGGNWESFKASGGTARLSHALQGMEIQLFQIPASPAFQPTLEDFWRRYLDLQGAGRLNYQSLGDL